MPGIYPIGVKPLHAVGVADAVSLGVIQRRITDAETILTVVNDYSVGLRHHGFEGRICGRTDRHIVYPEIVKHHRDLMRLYGSWSTEKGNPVGSAKKEHVIS